MNAPATPISPAAPAPVIPPTASGPVGNAPSLFDLDDIPSAVQDHAFVRIASLAAAAWAVHRNLDAFLVNPPEFALRAGSITIEAKAAIPAIIDVLLGGQVADNAEEIAEELIRADREPDADMVAAIIREYVTDADAERPPLPVVRIEGDAVVCPHCGTRDKVFQDARAVRHNHVYVEDERLLLADEEPERFVPDEAFVCDGCQGLVALPLEPIPCVEGETD